MFNETSFGLGSTWADMGYATKEAWRDAGKPSPPAAASAPASVPLSSPLDLIPNKLGGVPAVYWLIIGGFLFIILKRK